MSRALVITMRSPANEDEPRPAAPVHVCGGILGAVMSAAIAGQAGIVTLPWLGAGFLGVGFACSALPGVTVRLDR